MYPNGTSWPDGPSCWCDDIAPKGFCPNGTTTPIGQSACAWKPAGLEKMMELQHQANSYNEVVLSTKAYDAGLPGTLEAVFFLSTDECHNLDTCEPKARKVHADFLAKFKVSAAQVPLLSLNVSDAKLPFSCAAC